MAIFVKLIGLLLLVSCAALPAPPPPRATASAQLGLGKEGVATIAAQAIEDMAAFFNGQIVFTHRERCAVRVMLDSQKIENESAERFNFAQLQQAFVDRLTDKEHVKKLSLVGRRIRLIDGRRNYLGGNTSTARVCKMSGRGGADYVLAGRLISAEKITSDDQRERQTQLTLWLLDLETGGKAWVSRSFSLKRYGQNDVIYR